MKLQMHKQIRTATEERIGTVSRKTSGRLTLVLLVLFTKSPIFTFYMFFVSKDSLYRFYFYKCLIFYVIVCDYLQFLGSTEKSTLLGLN